MGAARDESDCTGIVASRYWWKNVRQKPRWQRLDTQGKITGND